MKFLVKGMSAATFLLLVLTTFAVAGERGDRCISVYEKGDKTYFKNTCNEDVTIFYCSKTKKMSGKYCGDNSSSTNPYYTHVMQLKPGQDKDKYKIGDYRYASCMGFINNWTDEAKEKFESDRQGGYTCK